MYKKKINVKGVITLLLISFFMLGCSDEKDVMNQDEENQAYSKIVELVNQTDYAEAEVEIERVYGMVEYDSGSSGFNKMNILRLFYIKQEMYDDAADVLMEYMDKNNYLEIEGGAEESEEFESVSYVTNQIKEIIDLVSEEKREKLIPYLGDEEE